ncbi:MAG: beta-galactosidase [bacterium]|nr:beta-galactosidase [bacterium]
MKKRFQIVRFFVLLIFLSILVLVYMAGLTPILEPRVWGVTYSQSSMEDFGIPWKEGYEAMLTDLGVKQIRLPVYWRLVEARRGTYDFRDLDYQVERAEEEGAEVILAVGRKVPRWPECHEPEWAKSLPRSEQEDLIKKYITATVERYKDSPNLLYWQVENEPFLPFGICPPLNVEFLEEEIALVKILDSSHPVLVTDSGELSLWFRAARRSDVFGTTMYRIIYKEPFGHVTYPLPPGFFRAKHKLTQWVAGERPMVVIELQGESWGPKPIPQMTQSEQEMSFSPEKFEGIIEYASKTGFDEFYLWGVEYWYWLKTKHDRPENWEIARGLFTSSPQK